VIIIITYRGLDDIRHYAKYSESEGDAEIVKPEEDPFELW